MNRSFRFFIIFFLVSFSNVIAQKCDLTISGVVVDEHEDEPLPYANIWIKELDEGVYTDLEGKFNLPSICPGEYHLEVSHIGCETQFVFIRIYKDTSLQVTMEHHAAYLEPVEVEGSANSNTLQSKSVISKEQLDVSAGKSIGQILENIGGVTTIRNGSGINKPVIHGMMGNRIAVINNGIRQGGQQWGVDHAPEIDPFAAKRITVVKGADALEYGGNALGGLVLVEPGVIKTDPHLHGAVFYKYQSNGRGNTTAAQLEQGGKFLKWRITGSFQKRGDQNTPEYFLRNTGFESKNYSVQFNKQIGERFISDLYYSFFSSEIGILRGAHIGNVTDLNFAIGRDEPFFTEDQFTYDVDAPKQDVQHQLLKFSQKFIINDKSSLAYVYGGQVNNRKEFDVRRGERSKIPSLDLNLISHHNEFYVRHDMKHDRLVNVGIQYQYQENSNDPGTGILPLIPDYQKNVVATYFKYKWKWKRKEFETGIRADGQQYEVQNISNTFPRVIENSSLNFLNLSALVAMRSEVRKHWITNASIGYVQRAPEINELFSFGLHQGIAGIEEGEENLVQEEALKAVWTNNIQIGKKLDVELVNYGHVIQNYIVLVPQDELRQTIRGSFPVFKYEQADAVITGWDLALKYYFNNWLDWRLQYSAVRGRDVENNVPLIYMPADRVSNSVQMDLPKWKVFKTTSVIVNSSYVLRQTRLNADQDFLATPPDYWLFGFRLQSDVLINKAQFKLFFEVENLLDTSYRDYLNRLRYYSDEPGRSFNIGLKWEF